MLLNKANLALSQDSNEDWLVHQRDEHCRAFAQLPYIITEVGQPVPLPQILQSVFCSVCRVIDRYVDNYDGIELPAMTRVERRLFLSYQNGAVIYPQAEISANRLIQQPFRGAVYQS
jgi:hypothetical protein